jgi:hypothetical protein
MNPLPSQLLREHISLQTEDPTVSSEFRICTTVEMEPYQGELFWIQLHKGTINFKHQDYPESDKLLGQILDEFPVPDDAELDPRSYMTFDILVFSVEQLNQLIDKIVLEYFTVRSQEDIIFRSEAL